MKTIISVTAAALLVAGLSSGAASAKHWHHHHHYHHDYRSEMVAPARAAFFGNNAELTGNNGNSASGDNSLGNVKGGNVGAGE